MKKVKIVLKPGSPGKKFYLFPNAESLYIWMCALERNEQVQVPGLEELVLDVGGFIEAELCGFEYAYEDGQKFRRLNLIRLGKAQQPKNASGLLVTTHSGWVAGGLLPMHDYEDASVEIELLSSPEDARLDLYALFGDSEDDDDSVDVKVEEDEEDSEENPEDDE